MPKFIKDSAIALLDSGVETSPRGKFEFRGCEYQK